MKLHEEPHTSGKICLCTVVPTPHPACIPNTSSVYTIFSLGIEFLLLSLPAFLFPKSWLSLPCFRKGSRNPQQALLVLKIAGGGFSQGRQLSADHSHWVVLVMWTYSWHSLGSRSHLNFGSTMAPRTFLCLSCSHYRVYLTNANWIRKGIGVRGRTHTFLTSSKFPVKKTGHIFMLLFFLIFSSFAFLLIFFSIKKKKLGIEKKDLRVGEGTLSHLTGDVICSDFK